MVRNKFSVVIYIIIGLAAIGLVSQLLTNTIGFLTKIVVMIGVAVAIFAVIYFIFTKNRAPSNDMKKYKQAVKQSKSKYKNKNKPPSTSVKQTHSISTKKKTNRRASHLRVIDGNKSKRKNRASF